MAVQILSKYVNKPRAPPHSSSTAALSHSHGLLLGNLRVGKTKTIRLYDAVPHSVVPGQRRFSLKWWKMPHLQP